MILYYAIISYCLLGSCSNTEDMQRYVYEEALPYEECLMMVDTMVNDAREYVPEVKSRPISTLCVRDNVLEDIDRYEVWIAGRPV